MATLSVILITLNEERNLPRCLASVPFADEIIVVDCGSTDGTADVVRKLGARFVHRDWEGYGRQKNYALSLATKDYVLVLDADEEITPELAREMREALAAQSPLDGYSFPRLARFMGRWLRHGNWYPDRRVRLFRRGAARFADVEVHESLVFEGTEGKLRGDLLHFSYESLGEYFVKFNRYTDLAAKKMLGEGRRARVVDLLVRPLWVFIRFYFVRLALLEGLPGFAAAALSSYYVFVKYLKLWELRKKKDGEPEAGG
jgi:glycosyltransferase involved in cell wall biosynthesis